MRLLYSYRECIDQYGTDYKIKKALENGLLYKLTAGIYSDKKSVSDAAIIQKKYPNTVFTMNSAFYYHGLTDTVPSFYYLATDKDATKIRDKRIKQIYDNNDSLKLGAEVKEYNGSDILIFSKERLLVELIRYKNSLPFDYYKEIIGNYRQLLYKLDFQLIEEYAEQLPKTKMVMDTIQMEVF